VPKVKTHRGAAKRMKVTGTGKVMRQMCGKVHKLEHKSAKRKRKLGKDVPVDKAFQKRAKRMLPYA
jgi:large subunit ribosomal protein L35